MLLKFFCEVKFWVCGGYALHDLRKLDCIGEKVGLLALTSPLLGHKGDRVGTKVRRVEVSGWAGDTNVTAHALQS